MIVCSLISSPSSMPTMRPSRITATPTSSARDSAVQWVDERGQIRPAFAHEMTPLPMVGGDD